MDTASKLEDVARLIDIYPRLTKPPAILLYLLMQRRGQTCTHAWVMTEYAEVTGEEPSMVNLDAIIQRLRRQTGLTVTRARGVGVRLELAG